MLGQWLSQPGALSSTLQAFGGSPGVEHSTDSQSPPQAESAGAAVTGHASGPLEAEAASSAATGESEARAASAASPSVGRQPSSGEAAVSQLAELAPEPSAALAAPPVSQVGKILQRSDNLILEGAFSAAQSALVAVGTEAAGTAQGDRAAFLIALSIELQGDSAAAATAYLNLAGNAQSLAARRQAAVSYARVLHRLGRHDVVVEALYREVLRLGSSELDALDSDTVHLLAQAVGDQAFEQSGASDPLDDQTLFGCRPSLTARHLLEQSVGLRATELPTGALEFQCDQRLGDDPGQVYVTLRGSETPVPEIIRRLGELSGRPIQWDSAAIRRISGRSLTVDVAGLDLATVLDSVLTPFGLAWFATSEGVEITPVMDLDADRSQAERFARLRRAVQWAISRAPDHPWSASAYVLLGRLEAGEGHLELALQMNRQAQKLARGRCLMEACLNEAKLALQVGERDSARASLYRCVDAIDSHPLKYVGYVYLGRIHLEDDDPHPAIALLQRAVLLTQQSPQEPLVATLLASALLLDGNPQGANTVLQNRAAILDSSEQRDAAAFLAAYSRYAAAVQGERRHREAASLIEALTRLEPAQLFGGHWWYLAAEAFRDVGITPEADRVTREVLLAQRRFPLRDRLVMRTLREQLQREPGMQGEAAIAELLKDADGHWGCDVRLAIAETEFRRGLDEQALQHAQQLAKDAAATPAVRRSALRLLGRIHQQRKEYDAALHCFSGVLPGTPLPELDLQTLSQSPASGGMR